MCKVLFMKNSVMCAVKQETITQNIKEPTLKPNVEISPEQEIEESLAESQRDEEMLELDQGITTELTETMQTDNERTNLANQDIQEVKEIADNLVLKEVASKRIEKCEQLKDWIHSTEWNGKSKRRLKKSLKWAIKNMNKMIKDMERLEDNWGHYSNLNVNKNRLGEIVYNYYTNREPARQMITLWKRVPHVNGFIDSERDARRMWRFISNSQEHQQKMAELLKDPMLLHLLWDDQHALSQYYTDVINWHIEPSTHPFYTQHMQSFLLMKKVSPELYWNLAPRMPWQITYNTYCQRDPQLYQQYLQNNNIVCHPASFNDRLWHKITDIMAKVFPWIDSDPRKRQAWEKAWSIAALGWAVVLWFQFLKNLFSNKTKNPDKRKNAWLYWWWLLALLNADKIIDWTKDAFGWHPAEKTRMLTETFQTYWFTDKQAIEIAGKYIWAPVTTMSALHFIPIYDLEKQKIIKNNNGEFEFDIDNFKDYVNELSWDPSQKEQVIKAWEKLNKEKCIWAWLGALWIKTRENFKSLFKWDKNKTLAQTEEVQNWYAKAIEKVKSWVNKVLYNQWLRVKDPDMMDKIMEQYGTWQKSRKEINALILDWMKHDLIEFNNDEKPYTIKDMLNDPEYTSEINFDKMTMRWFKNWTNEVEFTTYTELFETVYITNWIKKHFTWREDALDADPFHENAIWQLEFNNTERYELHKNETAVISVREFKNIPTVKKNKTAYIKYLNDWWFSQL